MKDLNNYILEERDKDYLSYLEEKVRLRKEILSEDEEAKLSEISTGISSLKNTEFYDNTIELRRRISGIKGRNIRLREKSYMQGLRERFYEIRKKEREEGLSEEERCELMKVGQELALNH